MIVPFYQKIEANPNAFRALLHPERAAARKDIIRRIPKASNKALKHSVCHAQASTPICSNSCVTPTKRPASDQPSTITSRRSPKHVRTQEVAREKDAILFAPPMTPSFHMDLFRED